MTLIVRNCKIMIRWEIRSLKWNENIKKIMGKRKEELNKTVDKRKETSKILLV
jgi:hypothetical protein